MNLLFANDRPGEYPASFYAATRAPFAPCTPLRGQTRPVTLSARVFRPQGTDPGYRERLAVQLTGTVRRSEFGATGFADMVGDEVRLKILARLVLSP